MEKLLDAVGLVKRYAKFTLQGVSLSVEAGKIVGFIGRNGAGKSTTLRAIVGLVHRDGGSVRICGMNIDENAAACKTVMGTVFGGLEFYPRKKLKDIAEVTRRFYPQWDTETYRKLTSRFSLDENKKVRELSNGMKVKFLLSLACSHRARLYVFDEPTSGLDPVSREEILSLMRALVRNGECGVLFSTQITSDLEKCADDIVFIRQGNIVHTAEKGEFIRSYAHLRQGRLPTLEEIMIAEEGVDEEFSF